MAKRTEKAKRAKAGTSALAAAQRRALFVEAFLASGNATEAAIAAGFSPRSARSRGHELVKDRDIAAEIAKRQEELADRYRLTAEDLRRSLAQAIYFDPRKLYRPDGTLRAVHELDDDTAMALAGVEVAVTSGKDGPTVATHKFKWLDKNSAREQGMRHVGMFEKDNAQKTDPIKELLALVSGAPGSRGVDHVKGAGR